LVVNDGSVDSTAEVARSEGPLEVLNHLRNRGKGAALLTGMKAARERGFKYALTLDADGQHPVEAIPDFQRGCEDNSRAILVGNRFADSSIRRMPIVRRLSNGASSRFISWAAGRRIPDAQCGMRIYPIAETLALNLESEGYAH
jgi:glycosyltransferase involved in cell wall biosynthesis